MSRWTPEPHRWTSDDDARLCRMIAARSTMIEVGAAIGVSRAAVSGRISRLRAKGDERLAAPDPAFALRSSNARQMDRLADLMTDGCPTLVEASYRMRLSAGSVERLWRGVRRGLGAQAV